MSINKYLTKIYTESGMEILYKAILLFYILISNIAMGLFYSIYNQKHFLSFVIAVIFIIANSVSFILLFKKRYKISVNLTIISSYLIVSIHNLTNSRYEPSLYLASAALFLCPLIIVISMFAYATWQGIFFTVATIINLILVYIFRTLPAIDSGLLTEVHRNGILEILIGPSLIGFCIYMIQRNQNKLMKATISSQIKIQDNYQQLSSLVQDIQKGLSIGKSLTASAEKTVNMTGAIQQKIKNITSEIENLDQNISRTKDYQMELLTNKTNLQSQASKQSESITDSSATIEEMTASIINITTSTEKKSVLLREFVDNVNDSVKYLTDASRSFLEIQKTSNNALEIINVIESIAGKTNLLAINAAIEATHAGVTGKGFTIVSQEIRKLAEETNKNSKMIKDTIQSNIQSINKSVDISQMSLELIKNIATKIDNISALFEELMQGMTDLSRGTEGVLKSVNNLKEVNHAANLSFDTMTKIIDFSVKNIESVQKSSFSVRELIRLINEKSNEILFEITNVNAIGVENEKNITTLRENTIKMNEAI